MGIDFTHFGLESSMVLQKFTGMYESIIGSIIISIIGSIPYK